MSKTEAPKKKGRPKSGPKTAEGLAKCKQTAFKKGQSGNPGGLNFRKPTLEFRTRCHDVVAEHGLKMLVNLMYDAYENQKHEECLEIIKWMASMAYGTPKPMETFPEQEETNKGQLKPLIVVDREALQNTLESDSDYT